MGRGVTYGTCKPLPLSEAEVKSGLQCRALTKRLSKDNVQAMSRGLGKAAGGHPGIFADVMLGACER